MNNSFDNLSLTEKYTYLSDKGKYIGVREYYNYFINLYLVENTFYELWYFRPTNHIDKIEPLEDEKTLDLYINQNQKQTD